MSGLLLSGAYLVMLLIRAGLALSQGQSSRSTGTAKAHNRDDIVVLQAVLSGDPALESTLAAALDALPAKVHVVWLVDEDDADALAITDRLARENRGRRVTQLTLPPPDAQQNPKTIKLAAGVAATQESVLVILDDDAQLGTAALNELIIALETSALATALPWYQDADTYPGALLARFVNDNAAMTYLAPLALIPPVSINGMCYAIERSTLDTIGGFSPLSSHLTDDLALASVLQHNGLEISQTSAPVRMHTSLSDLGAYSRLMHRWYLFATLLLAAHGIKVRLLALLFQGVPPLLLWAIVLTVILTPSATAFASLAFVVIVRVIVLNKLHQRFASDHARPRPFLSLLVELLQPVHLVHATFVRDIQWRSRRYRVNAIDDFIARQ